MDAINIESEQKYQEPWPTKAEFLQQRRQNIEWKRQRLSTFLDQAESILPFNDQERDHAITLLGNLLFGVQLVEQRTGEYLTEEVLLDTRPTKGYTGNPYRLPGRVDSVAGYAIELDAYVIKADWFRDLVTSLTYQKSGRSQHRLEGMLIEDFFLITGVEEGAHAAFTKLKSQDRITKSINAIKSNYASRANLNHEKRALLWKKTVVDRYFSNYEKQFEAAYKHFGFGQKESVNVITKAVRRLLRGRPN